MQKAKKVNVILPTYNGEKYIGQLLDSLFQQTYPNIEIFVRDDGSTDQTVKIVKQYSKKKVKGHKLTILPQENKSLGCPECFVEILRKAKDGDYYCFCDQDDVWDENKISEAVANIEKHSKDDIPTLHFGAYEMCDENLNFVHKSPAVPHNPKLHHLLYDFWPLGFNITFNKALYDAVFSNLPHKIYHHDTWFAQVALGVGKFIYSDRPTVKYRRQSSAVTYSNHNKFSLLAWRVNKFLRQRENLTELKDILKEYQNIFENELSPEDNKMLKTFTVDNLPNYFKRIFYPKRLRLKLTEELALRVLFTLNML